MILRNLSSGEIVATDVHVTRGWIERALGFLPKRTVPPNEGLWFEDCRSIHTICMRAGIDVAFLDSLQRVLRVVCHVPSGVPILACRNAAHVIELGAGALSNGSLRVGDAVAL